MATALVLLGRRSGVLVFPVALVRTREWAVMAIIVAAGAAAVVAEGLGLRRLAVGVPGTFGLLVAGLLAIAIW